MLGAGLVKQGIWCIEKLGITFTGSLNSLIFLNSWMMRLKDFMFFQKKLLFLSVVNRKLVYMTNISYIYICYMTPISFFSVL